MSDSNLKELWQASESQDGPSLDLETIKNQAEQFERRVRRRNALEWVASAFVLAWFGRDALLADTTLLAVGNGMIALAAVGISIYLWLNGRVQVDVNPTLDGVGFVKAQAEAMEKQASLIKMAPVWYVGPFAAGMVVLMAAQFPTGDKSLLGWGLTVGFMAAVLLLIVWFNLRAARAIQSQAQGLRASLD